MITHNYLIKQSQKKAILAFQNSARHVPFYKKYLLEQNLEPHKIKNIRDFQGLVPVLNKEKLFTRNLSDIKEICLKGKLTDTISILPSSGFSGIFSFGLNSKGDLKNQQKTINYLLAQTFDVSRKKTLLINTLSMGINMPATNVACLNTGPRSDIVLSAIQVFKNEFDQFILLGDNSFIKNTLEQGKNQGLQWSKIKVHLILGGESFPENFRSYLGDLLGIDFKARGHSLIGSSFGIAEIGLNILFETPESIELRRTLFNDDKLCPMLFSYNPMQFFIEEHNQELLFTTLDLKTKLPLIRYANGDIGNIMPIEKLPFLPLLPVVALRGRKDCLDFDGIKVNPELIKLAIYSDFSLPNFITGYFRMKKIGQLLSLEIQLKKDMHLPENLHNELKNTLRNYIDIETQLVFYAYGEFPYCQELDYERKFKYL